MQVIDLVFPVSGTSIAADHGYSVFGALCRVVPDLHGSESALAVGVHPVSGRLAGQRRLALDARSRLAIRVYIDGIDRLLPLAGRRLDVDGDRIVLGAPSIRQLRPSAAVRSRLVTIKGMLTPDDFLSAVGRQLGALEVEGTPGLVARRGEAALEANEAREARGPFVRRTVRIRDKEVVGFAVHVSNLTAEESIRLQERGLGGRRRFGCGLFVPTRG